MKKSLPILCCILLFSLLANSQEKQENTTFLIQGQLQGKEGTQLKLVHFSDFKTVVSTTIQDNQFELKGQLKTSPAIFLLQSKDADFPMLLVVENGDTLHIKGNSKDFPIAEISGNKQAVEMQQYQKEFLPFIQKAKDLKSSATGLTLKEDSAKIQKLQEKALHLSSQMKSTSLTFIQYHPDALASLFVLLKSIQFFPPPQIKQLFNSLSANVRNSTYGEMASASIDRLSVTKGVEAPDFTLENVSGQPVSLSSFRGKYVLIDFWASWCGPCRRENPNVVAAYNKYKDKNFTILGVSLDRKKSRWKAAIQQDHLNWTQVSDLKGWNSAAAKQYHVYSIPANFLLDPSGKIIARDLRGQALLSKLNEVLE